MSNTNNNSQKTVFVALSGGVDSAVTAALLKEQGYKVVGVFMKNWSGDDFGIQADCPWEEDQKDAQSVANHLGIEFRSFNFEKEYREKVVEYFFDEYKKGRTPNPDVMCNKEIKFKLFMQKAFDLGADLIATGHYARVKKEIHTDSDDEAEATYHLYNGIDDNKNQVYFIYNLNQSQLSRTLFPIGEYTKPQVRELAKKFSLPNANKPDSQGICFIGEIDVLKFLMKNIPEKTGDIIDIDTNEKVGEHNGIYFYTIGQRAKIANQLKPYFYCGKDKNKNILYVCHGHDHKALMKKEVILENIHWIADEKPENLDNLSASIRYRQEPSSGKLIMDDAEIKFIFDDAQRAVASGQSLVLFRGEECLGGGVIN